MSACPSVRPSVRMEQIGSHWMYFLEIRYLIIFRKYVEKIQVSFKLDKITGYLGEGQCAFLITFRSVLPRIRNDSEKCCTENENTQFIHKIQYKLNELRFPFFLENRAVCEIM
jgi:hypothetical protein